jgi:hypothetical protein
MTKRQAKIDDAVSNAIQMIGYGMLPQQRFDHFITQKLKYEVPPVKVGEISQALELLMERKARDQQILRIAMEMGKRVGGNPDDTLEAAAKLGAKVRDPVALVFLAGTPSGLRKDEAEALLLERLYAAERKLATN